MWRRCLRGNSAACSALKLAFSHFPCYPKQIGPSWCWFPGGRVCVRSRTLWGLSNELSCETGSFSHCHNPTGFYSQRFWGVISPRWNPGLLGLSHSSVVPPSLSAHKCGTTQSTSHHFAGSPLHPGCLSSPFLPVWMNVSSLTPWLLNFHTVWFFW